MENAGICEKEELKESHDQAEDNPQKRRARKTGKEKYLLSCNGRFDLSSASMEEIELKKEIPDYSGVLQIKRKLYVCGGSFA